MIKNKLINFTPLMDIDENFYPLPASKNIPDWYKKQESFMGDSKSFLQNGMINFTIKKCMPVFDALTAGYILFTHTDIYVHFDQNGSHFSCPNNKTAKNVVEFHINDQAKHHPNSNLMPYPKFINPWSVTTPNGYSCLFTSPMHNPNNFFTIMPGIVDTDTYKNPVHLPFVLNNPTFEGMIPVGTPICQIIPFKRDNFKMEIKEDSISVQSITKFAKKYQVKFINNYKTRFWQKKSYK